MNDKDIFNDGYSLPDSGESATSLASSSLRIALKAYFSTYKALELYNYSVIKALEDEKKDIYGIYLPNYYEAYAETILHFHHFIELAFKDILFAEHQLLGLNASDKPIILFRLLKGLKPSPTELEGIYTVDFSTSLKRLEALIKEGLLPSELYFIVESSSWLWKLNNVRNRIWHKGTYVMKIHAVDQAVGKFIFPFVKQLLDYPLLKEKYKETWKYQKLDCGYDPIDEISKEWKEDNPSFGKIAFLKELGRAAYDNPLEPDPDLRILNGLTIKIAELAAEYIESKAGFPVRRCPVCGIESFLIYKDPDVINLIPHLEKDKIKSMTKTEEVKCLCCGLNIFSSLKNPSAYGLDRIADFGFKYV